MKRRDFLRTGALSGAAALLPEQIQAEQRESSRAIVSDDFELEEKTIAELAREMAKEWTMMNYDTTESRTHNPVLDVHLLIYKIDGVMAVSFAKNEQAYYAGFQHCDVWVGIWKDGKWTTVGGTKRTRELAQPYH